ncbi:MAG TPA: PLDc N-terminal domain-containing protein [Ktedonobacterales bacterium]|nr:PLDc N-terminal domain-containing protein [Ktedonobacterales bacterium]
MRVFDDISVTPPPLLIVALMLLFLLIYVRIVKVFVDDLYLSERRVAGGDKTFWLVVIVFGSVIGIVAYLLVGREN